MITIRKHVNPEELQDMQWVQIGEDTLYCVSLRGDGLHYFNVDTGALAQVLYADTTA